MFSGSNPNLKGGHLKGGDSSFIVIIIILKFLSGVSNIVSSARLSHGNSNMF